ncbi:glycoside hydrolase family 5 protein [Actinopolyspora sp. BKK1]|nr:MULTISPECIES: glycoside hydrolase family 5 protein [unclassified Actinopolyspora]NHD16076.1 glycoside hydrolase family 5 protein [Actinopolyspora sp. BKK2]NHE74710.1 glycoside hydrolase family 5 protein [Actinopolyspora sp. BKK1]
MKSRLTALGTTLLIALASLLLGMPQASAASGFHVQDGRLYDANGNEFVMRGVNHAHAWYPDELDSLGDIKAQGANTVRVVLSSGDQWNRTDANEVRDIVSRCKQNRLVCVLEVHDTTGYGDDSAAVDLQRAVEYWKSVQSALDGQEKYVVVNLGNEPFGNDTASEWTGATKQAIRSMRSAGFDHTLMADAPNWGQDWSNTMRNNAGEVLAADPAGNTVFSVHMYGVYESASKIRDYLSSFTERGLPIVVGEFGHKHSDGDPNEDAIMSTAQSLGVGYLGWSWSGNGEGVGYLDMTENFNADNLTQWGERIFNGTDGIAATAEEATVY